MCSLHRSPNIIRAIKSRRLEEGRSAFKILTAKLIEKRSLGRPKRGWEEIIRMDIEEMGVNARNWIDSDQNTFLESILKNNMFLHQWKDFS